MFLRDIEAAHRPDPDGYAPVSNVLWTWLTVGLPPNPAAFRYLFAAARRLDTAHSLQVQVLAMLESCGGASIKARQKVFDALGLAELMCVALLWQPQPTTDPSLTWSALRLTVDTRINGPKIELRHVPGRPSV